jgi:hypothetical protein
MALLMMLPACGDDSGNHGDAKVDAPLTCLGSLPKVCFTKVPVTPVMVTEDINDINTDVIGIPPLVCDQNNEQKGTYCVIAGNGFTIPAGKRISAHGNKPLVLLSTTTFDLQGTVDVSSNHNPGATGAGAALACTGVTAATGNSGGYGGSFSGKGGDGEQLIGAGEAKGIAAAPVAFPQSLIGGCPGGNGSTNVAGATAGIGGAGGGAVSIIAMGMINLDGTINASGAGGHAGLLNKSGGGGGGSGGMIVLASESSSIVTAATAALFANGGGGGQGGAGGAGAGAGAGIDGGESPGPMTPAPGGNSTKDGGTGGNGSFGAGRLTGSNGGSSPAVNMGGGGAGGGGAGFIRAPGATGTNISPPST